MNGPVIVLETGSSWLRVGFSAEQSPRIKMPCIIGRARGNYKDSTRPCAIGDAAEAKRGVFALKYPIEHGVVTNWDDFEKILYHAFNNELRIDPSVCRIIVAEASMTPRFNREKLLQILMEEFNLNSVCLKWQSVLSLLSSGRTSGMVLDSGFGDSIAVPIYEGHPLTYACSHNGVGGSDVTWALMSLLQKSGYRLETTQERICVKEMKEKWCYVAENYQQELQTATQSIEKEHKLPDGTRVKLSSDRFTSPEMLFQSPLMGFENCPVQDMLYRAIKKCNNELHDIMLKNVGTCGGNTLFPGFGNRLQKELSSLSEAEGKSAASVLPSGGENSAWRGGALVAKMSTFPLMCVDTDMYDEYGPSLVSKMFF